MEVHVVLEVIAMMRMHRLVCVIVVYVKERGKQNSRELQRSEGSSHRSRRCRRRAPYPNRLLTIQIINLLKETINRARS